jgi:hypothetical protein
LDHDVIIVYGCCKSLRVILLVCYVANMVGRHQNLLTSVVYWHKLACSYPSSATLVALPSQADDLILPSDHSEVKYEWVDEATLISLKFLNFICFCV